MRKKGELPVRMCNKIGCKRAQSCAMCDACFNVHREPI